MAALNLCEFAVGKPQGGPAVSLQSPVLASNLTSRRVDLITEFPTAHHRLHDQPIIRHADHPHQGLAENCYCRSTWKEN